MAIGYVMKNNGFMVYGGKSEAYMDTSSFNRIFGTHRIPSHVKQIQKVLNGEKVDLQHGLYEKLSKIINKSGYPQCFQITVLHDLQIDPVIFEACIFQAMKSNENYIELRKHFLNVNFEFVPIPARNILNSIENEVALGNFFLECIEQFTIENIYVTFAKTIPILKSSNANKEVYCRACAELNIMNSFTYMARCKEHYRTLGKTCERHKRIFNELPGIVTTTSGISFDEKILTTPTKPKVTAKNFICQELAKGMNVKMD